MCGITGYLVRGEPASADLITRMTRTLEHRGPNDEGTYLDGEVALGHRRLSIIDLSPSGHQPFLSADGSRVLTYNGEIYNYQELQQELEEAGCRFRSSSDTAVILQALHTWGNDAVTKFIGMFAFALYDKVRKKILLVRDRAGVKPLYYVLNGAQLLFGSELKALMAHPRFEKTIDRRMISLYMQFGYIPAPYTIFTGCRKLVPGTYLAIDLEHLTAQETVYWNAGDQFRQDDLDLTEAEHLDNIERILKSSFNYRMVADVDVGVFLSGGIDSSTVTAVLQKDRARPVKTFTIGFAERDYDESGQARKVAEHLGTDHTEYICTRSDLLDLVRTLPYNYDEPFGDSSAINTALVSKLAVKDVKVALSADGGDEAFCGYSKYAVLQRIMGRLPGTALRKSFGSLLNLVPVDAVWLLNSMLPVSRRQQNIRDKFEKFRYTLRAGREHMLFAAATSYVQPHLVRGALNQYTDLLDHTAFGQWDELGSTGMLRKMMAIDYQAYMREDILTKVDRAGMSVSLEGREPLIDHRIIEYMARVPDRWHLHQGNSKFFLRKILYRYAPESLFDQPKKGFQVPLYEWLRQDGGDLLEHYLGEDMLRRTEMFRVRPVRRALARYRQGKYTNMSYLWFILMYQMWAEKWVL